MAQTIDFTQGKYRAPATPEQQQRRDKGTADIVQSNASAAQSTASAEATRAKTPEEVEKLRLENASKRRELSKPPLTAGQTKQDETFAAVLPDWPGKRANAFRQIAELQKAIHMLQTEQNISGPSVKMTPAIGGIRAMVNPAAKIVQDAVENSIDLKAQLDSQFAQKEAALVYARRYDPALPQKANLERAQVLLDSLVRRVAETESAARYWEETDPRTGTTRATLQGHKPADVGKLTNGILRVSMAEAQGIHIPPEEREAILRGDTPEILPTFRPNDPSGPQGGPDGLSSMPRMPDVWRQGNAPAPAQVGDETHARDTDLRINAQIQQAFDQGKSAEEIQHLARELYSATGSPAHLDEAQLQASIRYRDQFLNNGGVGPSGATVMPRETPLSEEQKRGLRVLESPDSAAVMALGNSLSAGLAPDIAGVFDPAKEEAMRFSMGRMRTLSPKASLGGDVAGYALLTSALTKGAVRLGAPALEAALAIEPAVAGIQGAAENPENRVFGGAMGAGTAALGSVAGRAVLAPPLEALGRRYLPGAPGKPGYADETVVGDIGDLADAERKLREAIDLGLPYGMADTSTHAQQLAVRAARESPDAAAAAQKTYPDRTRGRADRTVEAVDAYVAPAVDDVQTFEKGIRSNAQVAAGPEYDAAFSKPAVQDATLERILEQRYARDAMRRVRDEMRAEGKDPYAAGLADNADGETVAQGVLPWETLHNVRERLNDIITDAWDPVKGLPKAFNGHKALLARLDARLDTLNPEYKVARATYAKNVKPLDYFKAGMQAASGNTRMSQVENTLREIEKMPVGDDAEKALRDASLENYRRGFATSLRDSVLNVKDANPYNVVVGTPNQRAKLRAIGVDPDTFAKQAGMEGDMFATDAATRSAPAVQAAMDAKKTLSGTDLLAAVGETMAGSPSSSLNALAHSLALRPAVWNRARRFLPGHHNRVERRAAELAEQLIGNDPSAALANLQRARSGVAAYDQFAAPIRAGSAITGGTLAGSAGRAAQDEPAPYSAPRPLDQNLLVAGAFGQGAKVNPDGSVSTPAGGTVDAATVRQKIGETAASLSQYYDAPTPEAGLQDLASRYPEAPMNAAPDQIITPDYSKPAAPPSGLPPGFRVDPATGEIVGPDGTRYPALANPLTGPR